MTAFSKKIKRLKKTIFGNNAYQNADFPSRHNLQGRWDLIEPNLPGGPAWFLDIGANNGDTLKRLAAMGHFAVGLEVDKSAAAKTLPNNTAIMITEVNANTFNLMPRFSGIFLLSVFHRIWALQGPNAAIRILTAAGASADLLILEGCSRHARYTNKGKSPSPEFKDMDIQDSINWHLNLLKKAVNGGKASLLGITETLRTKDPRPIFIVKKT